MKPTPGGLQPHSKPDTVSSETGKQQKDTDEAELKKSNLLRYLQFSEFARKEAGGRISRKAMKNRLETERERRGVDFLQNLDPYLSSYVKYKTLR